MTKPITQAVRDLISRRVVRSALSEAVLMLADIVDTQAAELAQLKAACNPDGAAACNPAQCPGAAKPKADGKAKASAKPKDRPTPPATQAATQPAAQPAAAPAQQSTGLDPEYGDHGGGTEGTDPTTTPGDPGTPEGDGDQPILGADLPESQE